MEIEVHTRQRNYPIILEHGVLARAKEVIGECGQPVLISDTGVPEKWRNLLQQQYPQSPMIVVPHGEESKSIAQWAAILSRMLEENVSRKDVVIALGGGVVGDLAGFCAASYKRGIHWVNIPTTMLSIVDSSIGGKTAVDLDGIKNCVGAFWQPSMVLADPEVLSSLSPRLLSEGMAEAVKMGMTHDPGLFALFEHDDYMDHLDEIIYRSLEVKRKVVEHDEEENDERMLLNFGHTYGHAYESYYEMNRYLHGECVGMGMMTILKNPKLKQRLSAVLTRLNLPQSCDADREEICQLVQNDKKADHDTITIVQVDELGKGHLEKWNQEEIREGIGL